MEIEHGPRGYKETGLSTVPPQVLEGSEENSVKVEHFKHIVPMDTELHLQDLKRWVLLHKTQSIPKPLLFKR